ncbi:hypothetical protein [Variovorax sp. PAMC26660]|uniref:hypothetical protein n=1 Tax=Variovorax sp. PAMC26660 TaxID=2762322 RepID=UPI00164DFA56|nr:hypothetical protein [Variovorax sp. PAMC26660]QNK65807.1 hypothetical protein H7F35_21655 [Variovorax sp. PAMC26660]
MSYIWSSLWIILIRQKIFSITLSHSPMKNPLAIACALALIGAHGAHAQIASPASAEVAAFLASPTHCAVLVGGTDRTGDGADRSYGESLNKALMALGGPLPSAAEWLRSACASRLAPSDRLAKGAS